MCIEDIPIADLAIHNGLPIKKLIWEIEEEDIEQTLDLLEAVDNIHSLKAVNAFMC